MKYIFISLIMLIATIAALKFLPQGSPGNSLSIGGSKLNIDIADSDSERMLGLSGRPSLQPNAGLLFVFEKPGYYGFWMKDMNFAIDIAWLDKEKRVTHIEHGVATSTYPKVFYPASESLYVLETSAGFFENAKIKIGDIADF